MVNHVVLFKLKDYPNEKKQKVIYELQFLLQSLKDKIEKLIHIEVEI
jgi:hypothetical protein